MKPVIMVCVTRQKTCARLIELGARLAKKHQAKLLVVHALRNGGSVLGDCDEAGAMERLFSKTTESGGELMILRADDVAGALVETAQKHAARVIVLGSTPVTEPVSFAARLKTMLPHREIICVEGEIHEGDLKISINA
ncbi:MAG: hypothetical protein ACOYIR_08455 [Christensenellales bacterium]|jgi:K+-sensing histidine kinase KdpD